MLIHQLDMITGRWVLISMVGLCVLNLDASLLGSLQKAPQECEFAWKLSHESAVVYEVHDSYKGIKAGQFWLLGCEFERRIDTLNSSELPFRYLFRLPKGKQKVGSTWTVKEGVFLNYVGSMSPLEIAGTYRISQIKMLAANSIVPALGKLKPEASVPVEAALIEGQFQVVRGNWVNQTPGSFENKPSATFNTSAIVRLEDSAIIAGTYVWTGRAEEYLGKYTSPVVGKRTFQREFLLSSEVIQLSKAGLKNRIDSAITKGVRWLRAIQGKDGRFADPITVNDKWSYAREFLTSLSVLALLHSGVPPEDSSIRAAFDYLNSKNLIQSWDIGLNLVALEAKYLPLSNYEELTEFSESKARQQIGARLTPQDKSKAERLTATLISLQGKGGGFGYSDSSFENSQTTQYAALGLKSASRLGIQVPPSVWKGIIRFLEASQLTSGIEVDVRADFLGSGEQQRKVYEYGWDYTALADRRQSIQKYMQTNGIRVMSALAGIAICRSELLRLNELDTRTRLRIENLEWGALAWWSLNPSLRYAQHEGCMEFAALTHFYQWSVERAAVLSGVQLIGTHHWYFEGASHILSTQRDDGHWEGGQGTPIADTACALLFLKRSTVPVETGRPRVSTK